MNMAVGLLSSNPNITLDIVLANPDKPWNWYWLVRILILLLILFYLIQIYHGIGMFIFYIRTLTFDIVLANPRQTMELELFIF